ncbi:MAG: beta galactosidase jelly roll domain-containing protein [Chitinispirillaceae bacterium]|nr:beta galactosidase jelly roll domain-containing protein [Chitinispirillaceae bacterium]
MSKRRIVPVAGMVIAGLFFFAQAEFYPHRIYKERRKTSLDFGWKFYRGEPSGTPSDQNYNDGAWNTVNIPHSASYDPPTPEGERAALQGICWYRKRFTVPQSKHSGKLFIEFEGAMQTADVWLNGRKLGTHDNCGYTCFNFDITDKVSTTEPNVLAVRLDNQFSASIPPGCGGASLGIYPDYYLFSGIYRDVWLIATEKCYIPLYGQRISVPATTATAGQAQVRIATTVRNDDVAAKNVTLDYIITDSSDASVFSHTMEASIEAGQSYLFDTALGSIPQPNLWSPDNPYLYKVYTRVLVDGQPVDDYVERFGVRWYEWTPEGGFSLNGDHTVIKGACLHQSVAWVENALPNTRFFREVALVKEMGANLIRGAHFPRDPSFYNACDELGMMSMVEVPTWGTTSQAYPDSFWIRQNNVVREMIEVGYNHPSIIIWGLFNEPLNDFSEPQQIPLLNATAHALDSTRLTYMANNAKNSIRVFQVDVVGLNYGVDLEGELAGRKARTFNSEYHEGWLYWCFRGDVNDNAESGNYADERWKRWLAILNYSGTNKSAGGCMWSFNDYWSPFMDHPMGVVDHYRIPKAVFYYFRKQWVGTPEDYPVKGLITTQLVLTSDMETLFADSTDIAIITAAFRDENGTCVHTGYPDGIPVTFSVSGPVDCFGSLTVNAIAGKCALVVKSRNTAGTISLSATGNGITSNTVTMDAVDADTSPLPFISAVTCRPSQTTDRKIIIRQRATVLQVTIPVGVEPEDVVVSLFNIKGQKLTCPVSYKDRTCSMNLQRFPDGYYIASIRNTADNSSMTDKVIVTKR